MLSTRSLELLDYISFAILSLLQPYTVLCPADASQVQEINNSSDVALCPVNMLLFTKAEFK